MIIRQQLKDYIYCMKNQKEKKVKIELIASSQLPFVEHKKTDINYMRKNQSKNKSIQNNKSQINNSYNYSKPRSDRVRAEYIKICQQIKETYRYQKRVNQEKLIISDVGLGKPYAFSKFMPRLSNSKTEPNHDIISSPFSIALEAMCPKLGKHEFSYANFNNRNNTKLKPIPKSRMKRLETDYLNIQKIKVGVKQIRQRGLTPKQQSLDLSLQLRTNSANSEQYSPLGIKSNPSVKNRFTELKITSMKIISNRPQDQFDVQTPKSKVQEQMEESCPPLIGSKNQAKQVYSISTSVCSTTKPNQKGVVTKSSWSKNFILSQNMKKKTIQKKAFKPSFETYYYRDLLWKVNFSNELVIQTPLQYEHRLRVYIGKGNNSGLIRGLIKRRIWFAITDRIQQANFVWTQLKYLPYYNLQKQWKKQINQSEGSVKQYNIIEKGLFNDFQIQQWQIYFRDHQNIEERQDQKLKNRTKYFIHRNNNNNNKCLQIQSTEKLQVKKTIKLRTIIKTVNQIRQTKMHNHLRNNYMIGNKKTLFKTMSVYYKNRDDYVFNYLPHTFHIQNGVQDESYYRFLRFYYQRAKQIKAKYTGNNKNQQYNAWIVKPGENSNRGYGISVCKSLDQIKNMIKQREKLGDGSQRTYIVQAYLQKPLLYNKRKFDLRHYMMMTCVNGIVKGYWYRQGYVRTSAIQYSLQSKQSRIHLTNDAIQKMMPQYGKYEKGNKISYDQLHNYLQRLYGFKNYNFKDIIIPKMKKVTTDVIRACSGSIDTNFHGNNFEIFGLDFMIDSDFNLWLIEVNTNPCLEISCPILGMIIPKMIENALELTLDSMFPPPVRYTPKGTHYIKNLNEENKFDLVYDSRINGINREGIDVIDEKLLKEEDDEFEDDGEEWDQDD